MKNIKWAFIFKSPGAKPDTRPIVVDGEGVSAYLVAVDDNAIALRTARKLVDEGIHFIELCGSYINTPGFIDEVIAATDNRVPVGAVTFTDKAAKRIANLFESNGQ